MLHVQRLKLGLEKNHQVRFCDAIKPNMFVSETYGLSQRKVFQDGIQSSVEKKNQISKISKLKCVSGNSGQL